MCQVVPALPIKVISWRLVSGIWCDWFDALSDSLLVEGDNFYPALLMSSPYGLNISQSSRFPYVIFSRFPTGLCVCVYVCMHAACCLYSFCHCKRVTDNSLNLHSIALGTRNVIWSAVTPHMWLCNTQFTKLPWQCVTEFTQFTGHWT